MRNIATLSLLLAAGNAAAWDQDINFSLENNPWGFGTKIDFTIANELASGGGLQVSMAGEIRSISALVSQVQSYPTNGLTGWDGELPGTGNVRREIFTSIPTFGLQNIEAGVTVYAEGFFLQSNNVGGTIYQSIGFYFGDAGSGLQVSSGQHIRVVGVSSGSLTIPKSINFFNPGYWLVPGETQVSISPVPEPSTYGLALGGLALVGAVVIRRRRNK